MPTAFETADTLPEFDAVSPPSSGRYSWVDPARLETVRASDSRAERELAEMLDGRPWGMGGALKPVKVPKF